MGFLNCNNTESSLLRLYKMKLERWTSCILTHFIGSLHSLFFTGIVRLVVDVVENVLRYPNPGIRACAALKMVVLSRLIQVIDRSIPTSLLWILNFRILCEA